MGNPSIYPNKVGIYKLTCDNNGKIYIGKSVNIKQRLNNHKHSWKSSKKRWYLQNAIIKHGGESFNVEILEIVENFNKLKDNDILLEREEYYINVYDTTKND